MDDREYFRADEISARWRVSTRQVYLLAQRGDLTATYIGRSVRFTRTTIEAYERRNTRHVGQVTEE